MSTPFTAQGILTYPPDEGEAAADRTGTVQSQYDVKSEFELKLVGSGTHSVGFGTIDTTGAKAIMIELDTTAVAPVMVQLNSGGATGQLEISAGGFFIFASPNPTSNGVLAIDLVHTQDAKVWVRILG
jgi:hypothetical protein